MKPLTKWMRFVLRFAAIFNLCAGANMVLLPKITYEMIGMDPPSPRIDFPIQLVGVLVALFGVGYYQVARSPLENRMLLRLGMWSKGLGSVLATIYVVRGVLPPRFVPVYFFADVIYLVPFWLILKRLDRLAKVQASDETISEA